MLMQSVGRKRARKACIPCHQRKRKCDGEYPCGTCTTYEYPCSYASTGDDADALSIANNRLPASTSLLVRRLLRSVSSSTAEEEAKTDSRGSAAITATATATAIAPAVSPGNGMGNPSPSEAASAGDGTGSASTSPAGIFDENKSKYAGASAFMAFPHILGGLLGSDSPSKLHALAYNFGTRPEAAGDAHVHLRTLLSEEDLSLYADVYFSSLAPICDYLDARIFAQRCRDYYQHQSSQNGQLSDDLVIFSAVVAGVAALGSFLSSAGHPQEAQFVQHAKAILDGATSMRMLGIDYIVAQAVRVSYLRATNLPETVWIASCTLMHLCEAVGLHEEESIQKMASVAGAAVLGHDADRLRRIFWVSWAAHNIMAYEYDRSAVALRSVTCQAILPIRGSFADQFVQTAQIIPGPNSPFRIASQLQPLSPREDLFERLRALDRLPFSHPFLVVTNADLAFCFYRRIYQLKQGISDEIVQLLINFGTAAVDAGRQLVSQGRLFFNVIGSVFQFLCVLLAIDTPIATSHIAAAFQGLEDLTVAADTGLTREALSMARHLISLNTAKKRRELAELEAIEASHQPMPRQGQTQEQADSAVDNVDQLNTTALPDWDWDALNWEQFLIEPYRSMFGPG